MKTIFNIIAILFFLFFSITKVVGQDSLTLEVMQPLTHYFTIENGQLVGDGAEFLKREMTNSHIIMLGEYYPSARIPEFSNAIISDLDKLNFKNLILGTGPITTKIISNLSSDSEPFPKKLNQLHRKYLMEKNGKFYTPFPDFKTIESSQFVQSARKHNWSISGIGKESYSGFKMLLDEMYFNLSKSDKQHFQKLYQATTDSIEQFYKTHFPDLLPFSSALKQLDLLDEFLIKMAQTPENIELVAAFEFSLNTCWLQANKDFFAKNKKRVQIEKQLLRDALSSTGFDFNNDKLLIKMHQESLTKGISVDLFYEVGSTLFELAEYHNRKSLTIGFAQRFVKENDQEKDLLLSENINSLRLKNLIKLGEKKKWTIIDLRPMMEGFYYWPQKYLINEWVEDIIKRYDLLIIPPTEEVPSFP